MFHYPPLSYPDSYFHFVFILSFPTPFLPVLQCDVTIRELMCRNLACWISSFHLPHKERKPKLMWTPSRMESPPPNNDRFSFMSRKSLPHTYVNCYGSEAWMRIWHHVFRFRFQVLQANKGCNTCSSGSKYLKWHPSECSETKPTAWISCSTYYIFIYFNHMYSIGR